MQNDELDCVLNICVCKVKFSAVANFVGDFDHFRDVFDSLNGEME